MLSCSTGLWQRVLLLVSGCVLTFWGGNLWAFGAYINVVKAVFNMTQTEVETVNALGLIGWSTMFPVGLVLERFGPLVALSAGLVLTVVSFALLYVTCLYHTLMQSTAAYVGIYLVFIVEGLAGSIGWITPMTIVHQSFSARHRGKIIFTIHSFSAVGISTWSIIWGRGFADDSYSDSEQNLGGYFLCIGIVGAVTLLFGMKLIRVYPPEHLTDEYIELKDSNDNSSAIVTTDELNESLQLYHTEETYNSFWSRAKSMIKHPSLQLLAWGFMLALTTEDVLLANHAVMLESLFPHRDRSVDLITFGAAAPWALGFIASLGAGVVSDHIQIKYNMPRVTLDLIVSILMCLGVIALIVWMDNLVCLELVVSLAGICAGLNWGNIVARCVDYFGAKHSATDVGFIVFAYSIVQWVVMAVTGVLYDVETDHSTYCYGRGCFDSLLIILGLLSGVTIILSTVAFRRDRRILSEQRLC